MFIIDNIKQYLNIIIGVALVTVTFYGASLYYNHKIDTLNKDFTNYRHQTEQNIANQKVSILTQQNKLKEEKEILYKKLNEVENEKYEFYTELQAANSKLKSSVANGSNRLYINANCSKSANNQGGETEVTKSTSLDDGETTKAVIDPRDATAIIEITEKGDKCIAQLSGLQDWVLKLVTENNK
jgi:hypothetical protein